VPCPKKKTVAELANKRAVHCLSLSGARRARNDGTAKKESLRKSQTAACGASRAELAEELGDELLHGLAVGFKSPTICFRAVGCSAVQCIAVHCSAPQRRALLADRARRNRRQSQPASQSVAASEELCALRSKHTS